MAQGLETLPYRGPSPSPFPARSARGETRTPGTAGCRGRTSWRPRSGSHGRASRPGTGSSVRSRRPCRPSSRRSAPGSGFEQVYRPNGRAWRPGERVRLPALAATLDRLAEEGFEDFYEGEIADRQAAGLGAIGCQITGADLAAHASTWTQPISTTYRGVRVTTHPPNSSGIVALELINILETFEPPASIAFGPLGVDDARWIHLGIEAAKLAMADRDFHLTRSGVRRDPGRRADARRRTRRSWRGSSTRIGRRCPPASTLPRGGGTIYLATVDAEGNAVSLIESNYMGFGSGVVDPADRDPLPEPGLVLQPRPGPSERARAGQADAPHAAPRDAVPGRRAAAVGRDRVDGRRRPAADPRPGRVGPRRRRRGRRDRGRRAALVRRRRRAFRAAGQRPGRAAVPRRRSSTRSRRWATR